MRSKKNIHLMMAISCLQGMVFYASIATLYRQAAGISLFQIGVIESISLIVCLALEVPWGMLADRIGYRRTMIVCGVLYFISKIIFWHAESFAGFLLERLLLAVVLAGLSGVEESILYASCEAGERQRAFGWYNALGTAGLMIAAMLFSLFGEADYRLAGLWTVISYGLAAILTFGLEEVKSDCQRDEAPLASARKTLREVFRTPGLVMLLASEVLLVETVHFLTVFFNQLQYLRCGWTTPMIGVAYMLTTAAGLCGAASDRCTKAVGERGMGLLAPSLCAACCAVLALTANGWLSLGCMMLLCASSELLRPLMTHLKNRMIVSNDRATALSMASVLHSSAAACMNPAFGWVTDQSHGWTLAVCGALCLLSALMFLCSIRKKA